MFSLGKNSLFSSMIALGLMVALLASPVSAFAAESDGDVKAPAGKAESKTEEVVENVKAEAAPEEKKEKQVSVKKSAKKAAAGETQVTGLSLKIKGAPGEGEAFDNDLGSMKVVFSAEWSDKAKYDQYANDGWAFKYDLIDETGAVLKAGIDPKGYTHKVTEEGGSYRIKATATKDSNVSEVISDPFQGFTFPEAPKTVKATCEKGGNTVTVKWSKVAGADGYYVYRTLKKHGEPIKQIEGSKTSFVNKKLEGRKKYKFYVRAYVEDERDGQVFTTVSENSKVDKVLVEKYLTCKIRSYKWMATVKSTTGLYTKYTGGKKKGKVKKGTKVYLGMIKDKGANRRIFVTDRATNGKKIKGWARLGSMKGIKAEVAYDKKLKRGLDWTKAAKEAFVNKKGYTSRTKYMLWTNQYTQRVNIFKGKKGKWKLIKTARCTTGRFEAPTRDRYGIIYGHGPRRVKQFEGGSRRKYYYTHLSFFTRGNGSAYHTVAWFLDNHSLFLNVKGNLQPNSGGCIRMYVKDAKWIYSHIKAGTRSVIF